jgi:hypothetical protein
MSRGVVMVLMAAALLSSREAAAQMFKCTDAAGKVTYSSSACSTLGLKDAGEVKERIQVTPAFQPPAQRPARSAEDRPVATEKPAAEEEKKPERRCFTVTGAGGKKVTRCNDKPEE